MHLGVSSYTFTWAVGVPGSPPTQPLTALGLLDRAHALGIQVLQIADNLPLNVLSEKDLDILAKGAQQRGIQIEVGTRGIERDHLLRYLRLAEQLGSSMVRTIAHNTSVDDVIAKLKPVLRDFESSDVTLAIENHDQIPVSELVRIITRLESDTVGICLDTVNSFGALEGPEVVVETLAPYVVNLHIKDFNIERVSHMMGFTIQGTPAGKGRLDVPWLLAALEERRRERDFNAILELWTPPEIQLEDTIVKEAAWANESIAYLRTFIPDEARNIA
jgi:sugar phosphate isomerase/epimerase